MWLQWTWIGLLLGFHLAGIFSIVHALRHVRTAQATTAWCVGLLVQPVFVVPMYWVFGRSKFDGYRELMRKELTGNLVPALQFQQYLKPPNDAPRKTVLPLHRIANVVHQRILFGNELEPLIDGEQTFDVTFREISQAKKYVLAQFFIIEDDEIGDRFAEALIERAQAGVEVRLLYDDIGCQWLSADYIRRLEQAGVIVASFNMGEGLRHRLQLNFRNHRKLIVVDGEVALTGGLNVGDAYVDGGTRFGSWRDTHLRATGPVVQAMQASFSLDWYWARNEALSHLCWRPHQDGPGAGHDVSDPKGQAIVVPTGPADTGQRCTMMFCELAAIAEKRLWISTPYLVPNEAVSTALESAVARGVEVRVLIPRRPDHAIVFLAGYYFEDRLTRAGVAVFRYEHGFMHQKAVIVDNSVAAIGSANLDNRSLHLNFELTVLSSDRTFIGKVNRMLGKDFDHAIRSPQGDLSKRSFVFQILVGIARIFSPVL